MTYSVLPSPRPGPETGNRKPETGNRDRKPETGTGNRKPETGTGYRNWNRTRTPAPDADTGPGRGRRPRALSRRRIRQALRRLLAGARQPFGLALAPAALRTLGRRLGAALLFRLRFWGSCSEPQKGAGAGTGNPWWSGSRPSIAT